VIVVGLGSLKSNVPLSSERNPQHQIMLYLIVLSALSVMMMEMYIFQIRILTTIKFRVNWPFVM
jgi:hypothetical protein